MNPAGVMAPFSWTGLQSWRREEARLWNALCRLFPDPARWKEWISDGLGEFLECPAGLELRLRQRNTVDSVQPEVVFRLAKPEITIGREADSDVCIPLRSVGNRHARILIEADRCEIVDLGSALGTYLNNERLAPDQPVALTTGDRFAVFPYAFDVELAQLWARDSEVDVHQGETALATWGSFLSSSAGRVSFPVRFEPLPHTACLLAGREFLDRFATRLLEPLRLARPQGYLSEADTGLFEFLIAALFERVNRDLQFPYQIAVGPGGVRPEYPDSTRGFVLSASVRQLGLTGVFRVFLPISLVDSIAATSAGSPAACFAPVSWSFPVSAGSVELPASELAGIGPGDVLLLSGPRVLLFPGESARGWKFSAAEDNFDKAAIDKYFDSGVLTKDDMHETQEFTPQPEPDLGSLPVRIHAIVGEKEMTLAEANALARGTVVELDRAPTDPVRIAVNGRIIGEGQLVEVEGRLGVKILSWRPA